MVILFHFIPGNTFLHRLDIRIKLLLCVILGFFILFGGIIVLCIVSLITLTGLFMTSVPVRTMARELLGFFVFLFFIILVSSFTTPGEIIPGFENMPLNFTLEGIISGTFFAWRFLLIVLLGSCLTFTSTSDDFRKAVIWFLKPFPFINGKLLSTMISLVLRFVPEILDKAEEIKETHKSRCIKRKNPVLRLLSFSRTLMYKTFLRADEITLAMQARCYNPEDD